MINKNPMTRDGFDNLTRELQQLTTVERRAISKEIGIAREHGDISENAEYQYAKEKQGQIESRIAYIQDFLSNSQIISLSDILKNGKACFGSTVKILNCETEAVKEYKIVGELEADIKNKKISYKSPLAKCLIGKSAGDDVEMETPKSVQYWEILEINYI